MSQSPSNQVITLSATPLTPQSVPAPQYYERIIVTNESAGDVYVRTDGGVVTTAAGGFGAVVLPTAWRMVGNDQPRQPLVTQAEGSTVQNKGYQGATSPNLNPLASGNPTVVSVLATVASVVVGFEFV
jgi:hypothetical protein